MPDYRKPVSFLFALVLALSACGGGGGSGGPPVSMTDPEADQRQVISAAIQDARAAVAALEEEPSEDALAAAQEALATAKTAVMEADALTMGETDGYSVAIELLEDRLAPARTRVAEVRSEEAAGVLAAFDRHKIDGIGATVMHGTAPMMSGTVLGTPPKTVEGLATTVESAMAPAGAWSGGVYTASDQAGIEDRIVFYTDIAAPGPRPFSGEGGKYEDRLDQQARLPIEVADATLISSSHFPTGAGIRQHPGVPGEGVLLAGTFDGAAGAYSCMPVVGSPCTSSVRHGGGIQLEGGDRGWWFLPAPGATVLEPDAEYRYFGWWLREAGGARFVGAFHAGVGTDANEFALLVELQDKARYSGPAAGLVVTGGDEGPERAGEFTAMATLTADFGDDFEPGTVEGVIEAFEVDGEAMPSWSVSLGSAVIDHDGFIGAGGAARTVWTIEDMAEPPDATAPAAWQGRFHEAAADSVPTAVTGTFEAAYGKTHRMVGAFGTSRE